MYVANFYIGRDYTPGEIVPDTLPAETLKRLLDAGAIREVTPAPVPITPRTDFQQEAEEDAPEAEEDAPEENEEEEDEFEEAEAPEIDVMDGLVSAEPAETPKRKTAAKGGRRK